MDNYYLMKIIYKGKSFFAIWHTADTEDGFVTDAHRLAMFESAEEAAFFAEKNHIFLENGITTYDFSDVTELSEHIEDSANCRTIMDAWIFFSDLAKTENEEFLGDSDEELVLTVYKKLFYGSNLKAVNPGAEECHPEFDESERNICIQVLRNGFSMLDRQCYG